MLSCVKTRPAETIIPRRLGGSVRRHGSNLIPALLMLPGDRRKDALLFSEWCRLVDDIADDSALSPNEKLRALESWLMSIKTGTGLPEDFQEMILRRAIDHEMLLEIVRGMMMDAGEPRKIRYPSFPDLEIYCHRVASTVGLVSASIFGAKGDAVEQYAERLGIALQLTNILRDVAEDAAMGRIYIPESDLERFQVSEADLMESRHTPQMTHLLNHQAERADSFFAKAELAWSEMTTDQRQLMRPARLMSAVYRDLLLQMHRDRYDVLAKRYRVSNFRKLLILFRVMTSEN